MNYNNLDLNLLKTFVEVYECKSVLGASKKLFVSQPAVTSSIKKLEAFLGGALFVRKSKGVIPTAEGEQFYISCKELFRTLDNSINMFSSFTTLDKGTINIGSSSTIIRRLLLPFISQFSQKYPNVTISVLDAISTELERRLKIGDIDVAIMNLPILDEAFFNKTVLTKTTDCFIAPKDFEKTFISKNDLASQCIILQKKPSSNRDYFEKLCLENNLSITPKYEIGSFGLMTDFVEKGMGIAFTIKDFIKKDIEIGRVKQLETDLVIKPREVVALTNKASVNSFATSKFIDELKQYFQA